MQRAFVTLNDGSRQVHYRRGGAGAGPPLIVLPPTPDSSASITPPVDDHRTVFALDAPGYGESDPLPVPHPSIDAYAEALSETFDALQLEHADIAAWGSGASQAVAFASRYPARVASLQLHDTVTPAPQERDWLIANYAAPLEPKWDGGHLI